MRTWFLFLLIISVVVFADVPGLISYQGRLTDDVSGDPIADGNYSITFRLFDVELGGSMIWSENYPTLAVTGGLYSVMLGSNTPFPASVDFSEQYWLEVQVGATTLSSRYQLGASPYALNIADNIVKDTDQSFATDMRLTSGTGGDRAIFFGDGYYVGIGEYGGHDDQMLIDVYNDSIFVDAVGFFPLSSGSDFGSNDFQWKDAYYSGKFYIDGAATAGKYLGSDASGYLVWKDVPGGDDGDWTISGTNIYSTVPGNVGIGAVTPTQKLHIVGNARVTGGFYDSDNNPGTAGQILSSTATGTDWIDMSSTTLWGNTGDYLNPIGTVSDNIRIANVQDYQYGFYSDVNYSDGYGYGGCFKHTTAGNSRSYGVYGKATYTGSSNPSYTYGGYFESNSTTQDGYGIYAVANNDAGSDGFTKGAYIYVDNNGNDYAYGIEIEVDNNGSRAFGVDLNIDNYNESSIIYGIFSEAHTENDLNLEDCYGGYYYGHRSSSATGGDTYGLYAKASYGENVYGIYATTDGGTNQWAGYFDGKAYFSGNVSIGTDSTEAKLQVKDFSMDAYICGNSLFSNYGVVGIANDDAIGYLGRYYSFLGTTSYYGVDGAAYSTNKNYGVYGAASGGTTNWAGYFDGSVYGDDASAGIKAFLIDHPNDPEHKLLRHYSIESPEVLLIYRGVVELDETGTGEVSMPDYFIELADESGVTVVLTPIGRTPFLTSYEWDSQNAVVSIYGDRGREVSYQVSAERDDPVKRLLVKPVEEEKGDGTACPDGKLMIPEAYGYPKEMGATYNPEIHDRDK